MSFGSWGSDQVRRSSLNGRGEVGVKEGRKKEGRGKRKRRGGREGMEG